MKKGKSSRKSYKVTYPRPRKAKAGRASRSIKPFDKGKNRLAPKKILLLRKKAFKYKRKGRVQERKLLRKINKQLVVDMQLVGYTAEAIKSAKKLRLTVKVKKVEELKYRVTKVTFQKEVRKGKKKRRIKSYKVNGKWISAKRFLAKIRMSKYNAVIKHYRSMYGITLAEARELYRGLRDVNFGRRIFEALY